MTVEELIAKLQTMPQKAMVTVNGYEGGVNEVTAIGEPAPLSLNVHEEWYYGSHEYERYHEQYENAKYRTVIAVHIS